MNDESIVLLRLPPRIAVRVSEQIRAVRKRTDDRDGIARTQKRAGEDILGIGSSTILSSIWGEEGDVRSRIPEEVEEHLEDLDPEGFAKLERDTLHTSTTTATTFSWKHAGAERYIFRAGEDEYHATMIELPTTTELHKSTGEGITDVVAVGRVKRMLLVHPVLTSEPYPKALAHAGMDNKMEWKHGITTPMRNAVPDRFAPTSPEAERAKMGIDLRDVYRSEAHLLSLRSQLKGTSSGRMSSSSRTFVRDEIVEMPGWMVPLIRRNENNVHTVRYKDGDAKDGFRAETLRLMRTARDQQKKVAEALQRTKEVGGWPNYLRRAPLFSKPSI
jgi:hypothetical protein